MVLLPNSTINWSFIRWNGC